MKIHLVAGARPNFMKIAPLIREISKHKNIDYKLLHTGQHYDYNMSEVFFKGLEIPKPDINFNMKSTSHSATGKMMDAFEEYCVQEKPDIVIVVGDVDSTRAVSIVVAKIGSVIKLAHVEAGMRSGERDLPEEINRKVTDILSDYCFCTTEETRKNLRHEGISENKIFLVGDVMIEQLYHALPKADCDLKPPKDKYVLATLHRGYNVDNKNQLDAILSGLESVADQARVIFPMHPRTVQRVRSFGFKSRLKKFDVREPFGYLEMLSYLRDASLVITDSGGVQIETSVLNVPCLTVRKATEHGYTLTHGSNKLVKTDEIDKFAIDRLNNKTIYSGLDDDGKASEKIIKILEEKL
jgi:UDP-N-acetylglucosamine 2-epimerase (non-hydrolysing)